MTLDIIGAGFGRTGTESMKKALEILGHDPTYHMFEILPHADRVEMWIEILSGNRQPDWTAIFAGYTACVDWPAAYFWRELSELYPEAKILLTVRSSESWYASMEKTILKFMRQSAGNTTIGGNLAELVFDRRLDDKAHIIGVYERNIAEVQAAFGPDRLLTYELGSGWEPLCAFLQVPVPDVPYPSGNRSDQFQDNVDAVTAARARARAD